MKPERMVRNVNLSIRAAALIATLGLAGAAHAANGKSYPGVMCNSSGANVVRDLSAIYNPSPTAHVHVDCPIIQDGNGNLNTAIVVARDQHPDSPDPTVRHLDQVYCAAFATRFFDTATPAFFFFTQKSTEGQSATFQQLRMAGGVTAPASSMNIACRIPPRSASGMSGIGQYFSEEP